MKVKTNLFIILFSLLFTAGAFAETSIKAQVDKTGITTDDSLTYKLIIISSEKNIPVPAIPKFEGFNLVSQAQSSTISFAKGGTETHLVYVFILVPGEAGKIKIEPSKIKVGAVTYTSEQFEIEVTQGKVQPQIPPGQKQSEPETPKLTL